MTILSLPLDFKNNYLLNYKKTIMEKYIFTFEDGAHYIGSKITETDVMNVQDGILSIIRLSDGKQMTDLDNWNELPEWVSE